MCGSSDVEVGVPGVDDDGSAIADGLVAMEAAGYDGVAAGLGVPEQAACAIERTMSRMASVIIEPAPFLFWGRLRTHLVERVRARRPAGKCMRSESCRPGGTPGGVRLR
jgi:hypothetical protein